MHAIFSCGFPDQLRGANIMDVQKSWLNYTEPASKQKGKVSGATKIKLSMSVLICLLCSGAL